MPRPISATVHLNALRHNLASTHRASGAPKAWAVVKANAYGHGIERAYPGLQGADGFALLDLDEAQRVRALGWRGPILLLEGVFEPRDLELCSRLSLWHAVHCSEQIDMLAAHKTDSGHTVVLKMNSGMNRLGFKPERYRSAYARLAAMPQVQDIVLATHFSDADGERGIAHQMAAFNAATEGLAGERSVANSAASLRHALSSGANVSAHSALDVAADWVRIGIALYGSAPDFPDHSAQDWGLQPSISLRSRLIAVQDLWPGDTVGYGSGYTAQQAMRLGVVACGYADGYPRHCPSGTPVLIDGLRCEVAGRVSMDMITVDLRAAPAAQIGSEVVLWGQSAAHPGVQLPIDEVAQAGGTIAYELMCAIAQRVPFHTD